MMKKIILFLTSLTILFVIVGGVSTYAETISEKSVIPQDAEHVEMDVVKQVFIDYKWDVGFVGVIAEGCTDKSSPNYLYSEYRRLPDERCLESIGILSNTTMNTVYQIAFYDKDYAFISGYKSSAFHTEPINVDIPDKAVYYRLTCEAERIDEFEVYFFLQKDHSDFDDSFYVDEYHTVIIKSALEWQNGKAILMSDGTEVSNTRYSSSDYVTLPELESHNAEYVCVQFKNNRYCSIAFYDAEKGFIRASKNLGYRRFNAVTIPTNAAYVRFCTGNNYLDYAELVLKANTDKNISEDKKSSDINDSFPNRITDSEIAKDLLPEVTLASVGGDVTITKVEKGRYNVSGTTSDIVNCDIVHSINEIPFYFQKGGTYYLRYFTNFDSIKAKVLTYKDGIETKILEAANSSEFRIPDDAEGIVIRVTINHVTPPLNGSWFEIALFDAAKDCSDARKYKPLPPPMLTIIDDDGRIKFMEYLLPIVKELNVPITSANVTLWTEAREWSDKYIQAQQDKADGIITSEELAEIENKYLDIMAYLDATDVGWSHEASWAKKYMNWAEIRECQEAGAEIVSHTYAHREGDPSYSESLIQNEYQMSKNLLMSHGIYTDVVVYSKGSGWLPSVRRAGAKVFNYGIDCPNVEGTIGHHNNYVGDDPHRIHRYIFNSDFLEKGEEAIFEELDSLAASRTGWMIWMVHTSDRDWSQTKADVIRHALEHAIEIGLPVVTTAAGAREYYGTAYPQLDIYP